MMAMIRLPYIPGAVEWVYAHGDVKAKLAVSDRDSSFVHVYDPRSGSNEPIASKQVSFFFFFFYNLLLLFLESQRLKGLLYLLSLLFRYIRILLRS